MRNTKPSDLIAPAYAEARDQMIHACALQEHIIASAPVLPSSIAVHQGYLLFGSQRFVSGEDADVVAMVSGGPEEVRAYQGFLGGEFRQTTRADGGVLSELVGRMYGASFRIWHLAAVKAVA